MSAHSDLFSLKGKTAIVTGGCGILGQRFCHGLAAAGANVAVVDLSADASQTLATELSKQRGVKALGIGCDITDAKQVASMVAEGSLVVNSVRYLHIMQASRASEPAQEQKCPLPSTERSQPCWRSRQRPGDSTSLSWRVNWR